MTASPDYEKWDKHTDNSECQPSSSADAISLRLRRLAAAKNLSQSELARRSSVPAQTMSGYWTGKSLMKVGPLFDIAAALDCNPRWLATGQGQIVPPVEVDPTAADDDTRLLDAFRRLGADQRAHVLANAELLLGLVAIPYGGVAGHANATLHEKPRPFRGEGD